MAFPAFLIPLLPVIASSLAPYVTEGVKKAVAAVGASVPTVFKPAINILCAAGLAAVCGGDPTVGAGIGVATSAAFGLGKRS